MPAPTSPCSSRFIGCGRCMSSTISLSAAAWPGGQLERQHAPERVADAIVHDASTAPCARRPIRASAAAGRPGTGRTPRRSAAAARASERVERVDGRAGRREVHADRARRRRPGKPQARADIVRAADRRGPAAAASSASATSRRCIFGVIDRARSYTGTMRPVCKRVGVVGLDELEVGVGELEARVRVPLERPVQHEVIARVELVLQERRVEPRHARRPARVADQRLEDAEAGAPRRRAARTARSRR